jgi:hypothetical protein
LHGFASNCVAFVLHVLQNEHHLLCFAYFAATSHPMFWLVWTIDLWIHQPSLSIGYFRKTWYRPHYDTVVVPEWFQHKLNYFPFCQKNENLFIISVENFIKIIIIIMQDFDAQVWTPDLTYIKVLKWRQSAPLHCPSKYCVYYYL